MRSALVLLALLAGCPGHKELGPDAAQESSMTLPADHPLLAPWTGPHGDS